MNKRLKIELADEVVELELTARNVHWGKGFRVDVFDSCGEMRETTTFTCHPEFPDYELFQNMESAELREVCIEKFKSAEAQDALKKARESEAGIGVMFRLNG